MKANKTPEIRAKELFVLVNGSLLTWDAYNPDVKKGWIKLGRFVLALETKWTEVKRLNKNRK